MRVGANSTVKFASVPRVRLEVPPGDFLYIDARVGDQALPRPAYFPDYWKEIEWPSPDIGLTCLGQEREDDGWSTGVLVRTDVFARFCRLGAREPGDVLWFSDNYFDLPARGRHEVRVLSKEKLAVEDLSTGHWDTW